MSGIRTDNSPIGDHPAFDPRHPTFFFDFTAVLDRYKSLRRHPERVALMCQAVVRHVAPGELMVPDDRGFYLVVRSRQGLAADAMAEEINLALLRRLFGTLSPGDAVPSFRTVASGSIVELDDEPAHIPAAVAARTVKVKSSPVVSMPVASIGHPGFTPEFLPLIDLRRQTPPIYLCGAVTRRDGKKFFGAEALRFCHQQYRPSIDIAMLKFSLRQMPPRMPSKFVSAIATNVSYETLAWSRSRQLYQDVLGAADLSEGSSLIVKIDDIPAGIPALRLADVVASLRPFVKQIFVQLPDRDSSLLRGGCISPSGVCAVLPPGMTALETAQFASWLRFTASAQHALSCVLGAEGAPGLRLLRDAGIGYGSLRPENDNGTQQRLPLEVAAVSKRCAA